MPSDQGILARVFLWLVSSLSFSSILPPYGFSIPHAIFGQSLLPATYHAADPPITVLLSCSTILF